MRIVSYHDDANVGVRRGVVETGDERHRVFLRRTEHGERGDCSCQHAKCDAIALLAAQTTHSDGPAVHAKLEEPPTTLAVWYEIDRALNVEPRVAASAEDAGASFAAGTALATPPPRFVTAEDRTICEHLLSRPVPSAADLERLLATGRVRYRNQIVTAGASVEGDLEWDRADDGSQRLAIRSPPEMVLWPAPLAVAFDSGAGTLHYIDAGLGGGRKPSGPAFGLEAADRWRALVGEWARVAPKPFIPSEIVETTLPMQGELILSGAPKINLQACFRYGSRRVALTAETALIVDVDGERALRAARDWQFEKSLGDALCQVGLDRRSPRVSNELELARLINEGVSDLEEAGWQVTIAGAPTIVRAEPSDLAVRYGEAPHLRHGSRALSPGGPRLVGPNFVYLATEAGQVIVIPRALFEDVMAALIAEGPARAARAAAAAIEVDDDDVLAGRLEALRSDAPPRLPKGLRAELRPYQAAGLAWMQRLRAAGFGALLADDMGLGKTLQTLCHASRACQETPGARCLVVAPTSVGGNWLREAQRFVPTLKVAHYAGPKRRQSWLQRADVTITSYALLRRDCETLAAQRWGLVVLDEAQAIKNPHSATARAARQLDAVQRLALTGTPVENHLGELWAILRFSEPGILGGQSSFESAFRRPIEERADREIEGALHRRIAPFVLRRRRADVLGELPERTTSAVIVELDEQQRALYEAVRASAVKELAALGAEDASSKRDDPPGPLQDRARALRLLTRLRQVCCAPALLPKNFPGRLAPSAKLQRAMSMLRELTDEGHRVLVFSQFRRLLELLARTLEAAALPHLSLTGTTRDRDRVIAQFQRGTTPVFLISLKAGGAGLNLTAADTVLFLDPWWNPAIEEQAIARAHRMGQTEPVMVYRLIAAATVEEKIEALKASKRDLIDALSGGLERLDASDPELLARLIDA